MSNNSNPGSPSELIGHLKWVEVVFRRKHRNYADALYLGQSKLARWMNANPGWKRMSNFPVQMMGGIKCRYMMIRVR